MVLDTDSASLQPLMAKEPATAGKLSTKSLAAVLGPGLVVCLADSDIGGLVTMATTGARDGYTLLGLQALLVPVLYVAQQQVVVLGVCRQRSLVGLTLDHIGGVAAGLLLLACLLIGICAVISELSGVVAVGELLGLGEGPSCAIASALMVIIVVVGNHHVVERVCLCLGACLAVFVVAALLSGPAWGAVLTEGFDLPSPKVVTSLEFREVVIANIGTVITPWMLFYHMSAVIEKRITPDELPLAALDTGVGAVVTQIVMGAVLILFANTARGLNPEELPLREVFFHSMRPILGEAGTVACVACGLLGASLLASLVVSLGVAWNIADFRGEKSPLQLSVFDAPWFYGGYILIVVLCGLVVALDSVSLVTLNLAIQTLNGVSMPAIVGTCFFLATKPGVLPPQHRVQGLYAWISGSLLFMCSLLAVWMSLEAIPHTFQTMFAHKV